MRKIRTALRLARLGRPLPMAWPGEDAILPSAVNGAVARARLPQARFEVIRGVGHVPMIDDPKRIAQAILETTWKIDVLDDEMSRRGR